MSVKKFAFVIMILFAVVMSLPVSAVETRRPVREPLPSRTAYTTR